ncbi:MAG: HlyD family secretion protein [Ignavibacteriales bacterium]|nr:HlyD family secretion protein [Ignavibacteriales bacterium]
MAQSEDLKDKIKLESKEALLDNEKDESIDDVPLFKKKRMIIPLLLLLTAAAVGGYFWYMNMQDFVSTDDAYVAANSLSISTKMLGRINFLGTDEGDTVKTGQVLVKLDDGDFRAQEVSAKAGLGLVKNNIPLAQVNLNRAQNDFNRGETEYKSKIITKEQYDHLYGAFEAAKAEFNIELSKIPSAKSQIGVIESQLSNTIIKSPMEGVVAKRWVLTGDVVQPGQPIFTIYDLKNLWITANLEETKLTHIRVGEPVEIDVDAYPDVKFYGKVIDIGNYTASEFSLIPPNNASGNFTKVTQRVPVKISIDIANENKTVLRPGMSVEVSVKVK